MFRVCSGVCFGVCFSKVELPSLTRSWARQKNTNPHVLTSDVFSYWGIIQDPAKKKVGKLSLWPGPRFLLFHQENRPTYKLMLRCRRFHQRTMVSLAAPDCLKVSCRVIAVLSIWNLASGMTNQTIYKCNELLMPNYEGTKISPNETFFQRLAHKGALAFPERLP